MRVRRFERKRGADGEPLARLPEVTSFDEAVLALKTSRGALIEELTSVDGADSRVVGAAGATFVFTDGATAGIVVSTTAGNRVVRTSVAAAASLLFDSGEMARAEKVAGNQPQFDAVTGRESELVKTLDSNGASEG